VARTPVRRLIELGIEAGADYIPDVIETPLRRAFSIDVPKSKVSKPKASLAVTPKPRLALPAPPKQLALPAPGPGLPPFAVKPRGGQFWADKEITYGNNSPEAAARFGASPLALEQWVPEAEGVLGYVDRQASPAQQWLEKALTKYYKNDFGSPEDPLRDLAERGLHYDPEMTPERWQKTVTDYLTEDSLQGVLFPPNRAGGMSGAGDDLRGQTMAAMPWLAKIPATDKLYGISSGGLDLGHFTDEFLNALGDPRASGLPMDLGIRPESLGRMTFPQAVEQVGKINQFRAKEMERAALSNLDSPAVQTFKEYADDNPMGLRWTELKAPDEIDAPEFSIADQSYTQRGIRIGDQYYNVPFNMETGSADYEGYARDIAKRKALEDALKYEGDTMGHCVGGYCPDVMQGRSRIFSLRDAKGEPHVTIETKPYTQWLSLEHAADTDPDFGDAWNDWRYGYDISRTPGRPEGTFEDYLRENDPDLLSRFEGQNYAPDEIVQIKGKQNRAPKDDYLPFVQDFVKSQQWGNVGDLRNTGLVKLPDGRYITQQQYDSVIGDEGLDDRYQSYDFNARQFPRDPARMGPEDWEQFQRYFEGYAVGGRVCANRCFSKGKSAVYAVNKSRK
jgi:hypothetical protein